MIKEGAQNPIIHSFLESRSLTTQHVSYLTYPQEMHQHDPFLLQGVDRWIDVLHHVKGQSIAIVPDYDADGVLSGTLARVALSLLGFGDVYVYPPRTSDGYGLSKVSIDRVLAAQPDTTVLITTDNGSNAHDGVRYAKERGLTVLVTDHHIAKEVPCADAVVNPNGHGDHTYPFTDISGTTVIYKVLSAYVFRYVNDKTVWCDFRSLILLVGMSTISDMMPLLNENRYYVMESVKMLTFFVDGHDEGRISVHKDTPLHQYYRGLDLLVATLHRNDKLKYGIDANTFGFVIGPMLNSPRRMTGESELAFQLFQTTNVDIAAGQSISPSDALFEMNEQRKRYVQQLTAFLFAYIKETEDDPVYHMVFTASMNEGVAGLLSGNFTKAFDLPSIAFAASPTPMSNNSVLVGSARSPAYFDLHAFLTAMDQDHPGLIQKWGGHAQAAGITILSKDYERFHNVFVCRFLSSSSEQLTLSKDVDTHPLLKGEFVLTTKAYTHAVANEKITAGEEIPLYGERSVHTDPRLWEAVRFFEQLEPFGQGFPKPSFSVIIDMHDIARITYMGAEKQHVKLLLSNGLTVIHWRGADMFARPEPIEKDRTGNPVPDDRVFIVTGTLGINRFNGNESLQLIADDIQEWIGEPLTPSI